MVKQMNKPNGPYERQREREREKEREREYTLCKQSGSGATTLCITLCTTRPRGELCTKLCHQNFPYK